MANSLAMGLSLKTFLRMSAGSALVGAAVYLGAPNAVQAAQHQSYEYLTPSVLVEGIYPSMMGPENTDVNIRLVEDGEPELLWVTGYRADMVGQDPEEPRSAEFMCHNTFSIHDPVDVHAKVMGSGYYLTRRLFTLSQGQSELDFPPGFGIPVSSSQRFMLQSQVLNLREDRVGQDVRHKVETKFVADKELDREIKPLTLIDFGIALEVVDEQAQEMPDNPLSCAGDAGGQPTFTHGEREMTAHWMVKPGPEKRVTQLGKPFAFDTTIHYIAVHLHSYAESLELWDKTENKSVYKALCQPTDDGHGLAKVDHYSSAEGLKVHADHEYELISHYNNSSDKDQTAMAFMFCYAADPYFKKPHPMQLAQRSDEFCSKETPASAAPTKPIP